MTRANADQFLRRLTLHPKRRQKAGNLRIGCLPGHDLFHGGARFLLASGRRGRSFSG